MEENKWERVDENDPRRCQAVIPTRGQCINKAVDNSQYCLAHGGNKAAASAKKEKQRLYQVQRYRAKLNRLTDSEAHRSLQEEIGVLRMLMETHMNSCKDDHDLMLKSPILSDLAIKIDKILTNSTKLETLLGGMLDTTRALQFATEVVEVISRYVPDNDSREAIADEIMELLTRTFDSMREKPKNA